MPFPINKNSDEIKNHTKESQDFSSIIEMLRNPYSLLREISYGDIEKKAIKEVWINSEAKEDKTIKIGSVIEDQKIKNLQSKGLIKVIDEKNKIVAFTDSGKKLLNEAILSEEKTSFSFTKKASKELLSKNSYDFGNEVFVKINHPEIHGTKYVSLNKKIYKGSGKPQIIEDYKISTKSENGTNKSIKDYSENELIQILHLAKKIIDNHHEIRVAGEKIINIPIHRIKSFSQEILEELNSRWK